MIKTPSERRAVIADLSKRRIDKNQRKLSRLKRLLTILDSIIYSASIACVVLAIGDLVVMDTVLTPAREPFNVTTLSGKMILEKSNHSGWIYSGSGSILVDEDHDLQTQRSLMRGFVLARDVIEMIFLSITCYVTGMIRNHARAKDEIKDQIAEDAGLIALSRHGHNIALFREELLALLDDASDP